MAVKLPQRPTSLKSAIANFTASPVAVRCIQGSQPNLAPKPFRVAIARSSDMEGDRSKPAFSDEALNTKLIIDHVQLRFKL